MGNNLENQPSQEFGTLAEIAVALVRKEITVSEALRQRKRIQAAEIALKKANRWGKYNRGTSAPKTIVQPPDTEVIRKIIGADKKD
jgi:hypothetical protein